MKRVLVVSVLCLVWWTAIAAAQKPSDQKAASDALFDEGKRLLAAGDAEHACAKFEASLQLVDRLGVRLNLADCYERQGRTATAWSEFRTAASQADKLGDKRADFARQRGQALASRLVKLQLVVPAGSQVAGLELRRDGAVIPSVALGTPIPVDPGSYTIEASAPGHQAWTSRIEARATGEVITVEVPRLTPVVAAKPAPAQPVASAAQAPVPALPDVDRARRRRHRLGMGVGIGGVVALGTGVGLGLWARSKWGSVGTHCNADDVCDAEGVSINRDARRLGNIGTIVGGVGLAAVVTGVVLYVTAPSTRRVAEHARIEVGDDASVRLVLSTRF